MKINALNKERWASVLGGGALLTWAARRRSPLAIPLALGAAALVYRGVKGRWPIDPATIRNAVGNGRQEPQVTPEVGEVDPAMAFNRTHLPPDRDLVQEASEESFPASDPPSFSPGTA